MNQILDYSPNQGNKKSSGSDKIVHFFAVVMILFAIALIAIAGYNIYQKNQDNKQEVVAEEKAQIEVVQEETQAIIKVSHTKAVEKIIYSWNNGKETTIKATGESTLEEAIPLPAGENTLHIKVIDIDGGESTYEGEFTSESGEDILNPVIKLDITTDKKLKITATDETKLDFLTYRWNDEEEVEVKVTEEDPTKIEVEIEILRGINDLTISAVDNNNNTTTETKSFTGLTKPEVMIVVAADKKSAQVTVKHEEGLQKLTVNLNGTDHPIDLGAENPKEFMFGVNLAEGNNKIVVTATSVDGTETVATEEVNSTEEPTTEDPSTEEPTTDAPSTEEPTTGEPTTEEPTTENPSEEPSEEGLQISIEKTADGQSAHFKASDPSGIKELKLNLNDMDLDLSAVGELGENTKNVEFLVPLFDGNNKITFTVVPVEGTEKEEVKEIVK